MAEMTPRQRVQAILRGETPDRTGFVIWSNKLTGGAVDRALLAAGACVVVKSTVFDRSLGSIEAEFRAAAEADGSEVRRWTYRTPAGELSTALACRDGIGWRAEPLFKAPADYDAVLALIRDRRYSPCYERFLADDAAYGPRGLARPATEKSPLFEIIYEIMGMSGFATQWHENRGRVLEVAEALRADRAKRLAILAGSPAQYAVVDGNIELSVVGPERFEQHYAPVIREACDLLHAAGKATAVHLDGDNRRLAGLVAPLPVDVIESFTPPPDCDLSIAEALRAWPGKRLMVNFPSSVHLAGPEAVRSAARHLLDEARGSGRVLLGVMENVPRTDALAALAETVREFG